MGWDGMYLRYLSMLFFASFFSLVGEWYGGRDGRREGVHEMQAINCLFVRG
jgi:hypothetical protein